MTTRLANCTTVTTLAALMTAQQGSPNASLLSRLSAQSPVTPASARPAVRSAVWVESRQRPVASALLQHGGKSRLASCPVVRCPGMLLRSDAPDAGPGLKPTLAGLNIGEGAMDGIAGGGATGPSAGRPPPGGRSNRQTRRRLRHRPAASVLHPADQQSADPRAAAAPARALSSTRRTSNRQI